MTSAQYDFIVKARDAAVYAGHVWPDAAACEAALESSYGTSQLARDDNNLFGMKQHSHPVYGTHVLPTREFIDANHDGQKEWVTVNADWVKYPSWRECFQDRMETLKRLAPHYPHYAAALAAREPTSYILEVSQTWASDPRRGYKVLDIYSAYYKSGLVPMAPDITGEISM